MNKKHSILPLIVIVLYLLTISGGVRYENKLTTFSNVFTPLLEQMMQAQTEEEKLAIGGQMDASVKLLDITANEKILIMPFYMQVAVEKLTLGRLHCTFAWQEPCKTFTTAIIEAAQERKQVLARYGQDTSSVDMLSAATKYNVLDHSLKIITLVIEALALSMLIGLAWTKWKNRKKHKK